MSDCCEIMPSLQKFSHFSYDQACRLGSGASSVVYRGIDFSNNETVAVKAIQLDSLTATVQKLLVQQETAVLQALKISNTKNVIRCRSIDKSDGKLRIVMDFCEGGDLNKIIKSGKLSQRLALEILRDIITGYLELNKRNVVHRDLKPDNILMKNGKEAYIADYGFSVIQEEEVKKYSYIVGSPGYLAPEALGEGKFGAKSDIWALGVLTYVMLETKTPWKGKNQKDLLNKLKSVPIDSFLQGKTYEPLLTKFMKAALNVDLQKRMGIPELSDFLEEVKQFLKGKNQQSSERPSSINTQNCEGGAENMKVASKKIEKKGKLAAKEKKSSNHTNKETMSAGKISEPLHNLKKKVLYQ